VQKASHKVAAVTDRDSSMHIKRIHIFVHARAGTSGCAGTPSRPGCMIHAAAVGAGGAREHLPLDQDDPHPPAPGPRPGCLSPAPARWPGMGSLPGLESHPPMPARIQVVPARPGPAGFDSRSPRSSVAALPAKNVPRQGLLPRGGREKESPCFLRPPPQAVLPLH
jgi:hypothetical protein